MVYKLPRDYMGQDSLLASCKRLSSNCGTHWHEFYEIEYVKSGKGICTVNGQPFSFEEGMLFFMTPTDFHSVRTDGADIINLMFLADLATPSHLAPFTSRNVPKTIAIPPGTRPFLTALLEEIVACQEDLTYCSSLIDCLLLKLMQHFVPFSENNWSSASQKMHFFIMNHFKEKISLEDAASHAGLTPAYASAVFKKEMQINFKNFLNDLRFDYARKLLVYSNLTVAQICTESGFEDYPNFIRRFKAHFGMTPTELRQKNS